MTKIATDLAPGAIGSGVVTAFLKGTPWPQRIAMAIGGTAAAHFLAKPIAMYFSAPDWQAAVGFLLGLFSMGVIRKGWETIEGLELGGVISDWLRKIFGLPPKGGPNA